MVYCLYMISLIGFLFPKSRRAIWIEAVSMTLFYGGYNGNIDLVHYIWQYENEGMTDWIVQKLFCAVGIVFHSVGIPFEIYHLIITFVSITILTVIINKLSDEPAYVLSVVSLFVYAEYGWQLKSMIATSFIVLALYWYYKEIFGQRLRLKKVYIYILLILIAVQFHYLALFFLIFLFQPVIADRFVKVFILDAALLMFVPAAISAMAVVAKSLSTYLNHVSIASFVITVLWQIIGAVIVYGSFTHMNQHMDKGKEFYLEGTKMMLLLLPFYYYANVAARIYKIWIIFMAVYFSKGTRGKWLTGRDRLCFDVYILGSYVFWYFLLFRIQGRESIIFNALNHNIFQ